MIVEIEAADNGIENEIEVFITTESDRWHVMNIAPEYGIRRVLDIDDEEIPTDDRGRIIIL